MNFKFISKVLKVFRAGNVEAEAYEVSRDYNHQ